jgi:translocation and assembly module TamB
MLKWIGLVLVGLLLLVVVLSLWLLRTESGLHFVLARAIGASGGHLTIGASSGHLAGPVELEGLRYRDGEAGADVSVKHASIAFAPFELAALRLHVTRLALEGVEVALTTVPPKPAQPSAPFSLAAPLDVVLDRLALAQARVTRDGTPLVAIDTLDLGGRWTHEGIALSSLALRSPDGTVDLHGSVSALPGWPGNGALAFRWAVGGEDYAGTLAASGDGHAAQFDLALQEPLAATLAATLTQTAALPWQATLRVPHFDPKRLAGDVSIASLALDLQGSGDRAQGSVRGSVDIDAHRVLLDPFDYALDGDRLRIRALTLRSPEAAGDLHANGEIDFAAQPVTATLAVDWKDVVLPADLAGQALATHGRLDVAGSAERFRANGTLALGPPGRLADIAINLDGTPERVALTHLALKQASGGLDVHGTVTLKPQPGWDLEAHANRLDPGAFAAAWPGALDFDLATRGTLTDRGPDATFRLGRLGGTLRKRPLSGRADLALHPGYVVDGTLDIASGRSRIQANGRGGGGTTDASVKFAIASLGDWLPDAGGHLDGTFRAQGTWPRLALTGHAEGAQLAVGATRIGTLAVDADLASLQPPQGRASVRGGGFASGALLFDTFGLESKGNRQAHTVTLHARGTPLDVSLALAGALGDGGRWSGSLDTLDLGVHGAPPLALEHATALAWDGSTFRLGDACLAGGGARLCVAGEGGADGSAAARYRIDQVPLALVARLASPDAPLKVEGTIAGTGDLHRTAAGALDVNADLHSPRGSVALVDQPAQPLLAYRDFALAARSASSTTHATVHATLDQDGKLDGDVTLGGARGSAQSLDGRIDLILNRLDFVELLTPELASTRGRLEAHYRFAGTTAAPRLQGSLELADFATEVPSAGLKLHDGAVTVRATDADHFRLDGHVKSGEGTLALAGSGGIGANAPLQATIKGDRFLAADIPAARVVVSPDLVIQRDSEQLKLAGSLAIPSADVHLDKLPGGGVSQRSPDVVVTDAEHPAAGQPLPVVVGVEVKLGRDVKLAGHGFDGKMRGQLRVDQRPGRAPTGTGTLTVSGTYKAYGQDLSIETGRVLFAGTPLDNPGLDIRAVRKVLGASGGFGDDTVTAGLQVRGTALVPVLTVFSEPAMEQSEALSYLITGKPLSGLKSGEGDMLGSAARALGSATGDLLAKGIGARTGLDAGVSDNAALGGAAFTVGKYLSPKLYLSYGVGLFTPGEVVSLKYLFNRRWNFEAQNATTGNRAGINYRWEH